MSVSDPYGRVVAERASAGETGALLLVQTPMGNAQATLYARWGDVLGWLSLALCGALGLLHLTGRWRSPASTNRALPR